jgi:hypothetical protein
MKSTSIASRSKTLDKRANEDSGNGAGDYEASEQDQTFHGVSEFCRPKRIIEEVSVISKYYRRCSPNAGVGEAGNVDGTETVIPDSMQGLGTFTGEMSCLGSTTFSQPGPHVR